jgi:hypothetical protein
VYHHLYSVWPRDVSARGIAAVDLTASPTTDAQLHLPLRHGECGVRVPGAHGIESQVVRLAFAMRLAFAVLALRAMCSGPALLRPFDGPHRTACTATWQEAMAAAPSLWSDKATCLYEPPRLPTLPLLPKAHSPSTKSMQPRTT